MDDFNESKRARYSKDYSEEYGSDDSNIQSAISPSSINSQLANFLVKSETINDVGDEDEMSPIQDYQLAGSNHIPFNVFQLLQKDAAQLNDVDLHVLITRCKEAPVIFRRNRDETYATLLYHPSGKEMDAEPTNYVECRLCAKIFTRSGGHLKRHRSKHYPDMEIITPTSAMCFEPSVVIPQQPHRPMPQQSVPHHPILPHPPPVFSTIEMTKNFRQNSPNLPAVNNLDFNLIRPNEKENLAKALTQFCVQEGLTPTILQRRSFVDLVNALLSLGVSRNQHQLVANMILPPAELITTCIYRRFGWLCNEKIPKIQTDLLIFNGAFTVGCLPAAPKLTALSLHYFDRTWTLKKAVVGLAPSELNESQSILTWNQCLDSVAVVNLQRQTLSHLVCVSGINTAVYAGLLTPENRSILCTCDLIEQIVDEAFDLSVELDNKSSNDVKFVDNLVNAAKLVMKYSRFQIFNYSVKVPPDTVYKWLKILRIVEFAREELGPLRAESTKPEIQNSLPVEFFDALQTLDLNRDFIANLTDFLKIFRVAIVELQAIEEPTLPLVWPAIMTLKYDLSSFSEESQFLALKTLASRALQLIERDFPKLIKDEHRTATFLNPKQRKLQHLLSPDEYEKFKDKLRQRLSIDKPQVERKPGDKRRIFYEDDEDSDEIGDEIDRYLNAKRSGNETIVEFWRRNESVLPKLSAEARRLLACPPSTNYVCGNLSHYVSKMTEFSVDAIAKLVITRSLEQI